MDEVALTNMIRDTLESAVKEIVDDIISSIKNSDEFKNAVEIQLKNANRAYDGKIPPEIIDSLVSFVNVGPEMTVPDQVGKIKTDSKYRKKLAKMLLNQGVPRKRIRSILHLRNE